MLNFSRIKKLLPLIIILLVLVSGGSVLFLRSPVLIITDTSFSRLYGTLRQGVGLLKTSLVLFRRVIPVTVAESAGPDLLTLAADGAAPSPLAVLFPSRYLEGARRYKETHPGIPVLVTVGNPNPQEKTGLAFVGTDTAQDLYRAGLCAAVFAGANKGVLFFTDRVLSNEYRATFRSGLRAQGFLGEPVYLNASTDYSNYSTVGCVVIAGPAVKFLDRNLNIPVILFSWANPALTPRTVKIVFDDSPLALAEKALGNLSAGNEILVPSVPVVMADRIEAKKDFRKIQGLIKENFQKK